MESKEPTKEHRQILRELPDEQFLNVIKKYPENVFVKGEVLRRKNERIKNRKVTLIGK